MSALALSLLGPLEIQREGKSLALPSVRSAQALLAILAEDGHPQARDVLVELLWPGMGPQYGRKNLRQTLYELRKALPSAGTAGDGEPIPLLLADRQTIGLNPEADITVDTAEFAELIRSGLPEKLAQAVALYRGDFLAGFLLPDSSSFEAWVSSRRAAYEREVLDALERLAELALSAGEYDKAEQFARCQIALDDLRETAARQLMLALAQQGQRSAALQAYGELRERLEDALNVDPAAETTDIFQQIQEETLVTPRVEGIARKPVDTQRQEMGGAVAAATLPHNLPSDATPFIGRTQEVGEIERLLLSTDARLLTLLGPGGVGKSRLALEVARRLVGHSQFPDGVWFVPLAAFETGEEIAPAIAAALPLDLRSLQEPDRQLLDYLHDKQLLLLLDNLEQLLPSGPLSLLSRILARAPGVRVLATSRAPLHVQGEQLFRLSGLALPEAAQPFSTEEVCDWARQYDGVRLFESSAQRVCPDFNLSEENVEAVLAIGRMVEGFPLGLEMAAAWMELLAPDEIAKELAQSFDLLQAEWTPTADRHRSARAVFDWSWRLLSDQEQTLCQALSLFRGGFSREAGLAVGQASLPALLNLKRKSWLQQSGPDRYHIHELLRQYAEERLRQNKAALQQALMAYAHYFVSYFERLSATARGPQQRESFEAIEQDLDNARAAWHWLIEQKRYGEIVNSLLPAFFFYATATGRFAETSSLITQSREHLAREDGSEERETALLAFNAAECKLWYDYLGGDFFGEVTVPWQILRESWEILNREPAGFAAGPWALILTTFYGWQQERTQGLRRLRELVRYHRDGPDRWLYAYARQSLGQLLIMRATLSIDLSWAELQAERDEALDCFQEALDIFVKLGDVIEQSRTLRWIGHMLQGEDPRSALSYFHRADSLVASTGLPPVHNYAHRASCHFSLGEYEEGFRIYREARQYYRQQGNRVMLGGVMSLESLQALRYGDLGQARELRQAAVAIHEELDHADGIYFGFYELGEIERIAGNSEAARQYYEEGLRLFTGYRDSHGRAFCQRGLGDVALMEDDCEAAYARYEEALSQAKVPFVHSWLSCQAQIRLAQAALCLGDRDTAESHLQQVGRLLRFRAVIDTKDLLVLGLAEVAALLMAMKAYGRALALAIFVAKHPASWHETRWRAEEIGASAAAALTPAEISAAEEEARELTLEQAQVWAGWE